MEEQSDYTCKHCSPYSGQCYLKSGYSIEQIGKIHYSRACTGTCDEYEKDE